MWYCFWKFRQGNGIKLIKLLQALSGCLSPHPISKAAPSHPAEETHFSHLYPRSHSFGHYPKLMTIGEDWNEDQLVNWKICLLAQLPLHHDSPVKCLHYCWCCTNPPVDLTLHLNKTLRYLNSFAWGSSSLPTQRERSTFSGREPWPQVVVTLIPTASCSTANHSSACWRWQSDEAKITTSFAMQRAETQFWGLQTGYSPAPICALRSYPWISQTELVTRYNLSGGQHPLKMWKMFNTSLETCHVPVCFRSSTIISNSKKQGPQDLMTTNPLPWPLW